MAQNNSPFAPFGAPQPEEELLYPEQGMRFGNTNNLLMGEQSTGNGGSVATTDVDNNTAGQVPMVGGFEVRGKGAERFATGTPESSDPLYSELYSDPGGYSAAIDAAQLGLAEENRKAAIQSRIYDRERDMIRDGSGSTILGQLAQVPGQMSNNADDFFGKFQRAVSGKEEMGYTPEFSSGPAVIADALKLELGESGDRILTGLGVDTSSFKGQVNDTPQDPTIASETSIPKGAPGSPQGLAGQTFGTLNPLKEAEAGSPQAIFENIRAKGQLSPELIAAGQARADAMGTTFDPETGFSRDAYLEGKANLGGPMGVDETRARLGGRTLNEYLNAPSGTEGVYGLRTDPQGRMIPAGAPGTSQTRADAYGQYEDEVSQAYQRQSERIQQRADQRDGTAGPRTYGDYTTSQLRGMVGGGDNLRAAQMRAEAGLNPVTGNREKTEAERLQSEQQGQLQNEVLQARLDSFKQTDPDKLSKAQAYAERLGLTGDSATAFIFSQMGTSMDDIFGLEGTGAGGGGGSFTEAQQSSISKVMAANPGSSREQIIAEMKKQGKL